MNIGRPETDLAKLKMTDSSGCDSGWWNSWLQAAKDTSSSALEFVKKDLSEYTSTVQEDTNRLAINVKCKLTQENATVAGQKVKEGVSSLLGGLSKALTIEAEDLHKPLLPQYSDPPLFDRSKARLHAIQIDPGTYTNEPTGSPQEFNDWFATFLIEEKKAEISELLVANVQVRALYTHLVPSMLAHALFWQRYFYKIHRLAKDEALRNTLMERTEKQEHDTQWDEDEDWCDITGPASPLREAETSEGAGPISQPLIAVPASPSQDVGTTKTADPVLPVVNEPTSESNDVRILTETVAKDSEADEAVKSDRDVSKTVGTDGNAAAARGETVTSPSGKTQEQPVSSGDIQRDSVTENCVTETSHVEKPASVVPTPVTAAVNEDTDLSEVSQPLHVDVGSHGAGLPSVAGGDARRASSESMEMKMKVRGDLVVVGSCSSDSASPSTDSVISSGHKELLDDDWELDVEPTEKDMNQMNELGVTAPGPHDKKDDDDDEDDWENWE